MGISIARTMKQRVKDISELDRVIGYIEGELRYNHSLLYEAVLKSRTKSDVRFGRWLDALKKELAPSCAGDRSVNDIWRESLSILMQDTQLIKEDLELLYGFGQAFGYLDIIAQENAILLERKRLQDAIKKLSESLEKRMKLAFTMSALCGLFLVVILL